MRRRDILNKILNYLIFRGVFLILIPLLNVNLLKSCSRLLVAPDEENVVLILVVLDVI